MTIFTKIINEKSFKDNNLMINLVDLFQDLKNNGFERKDMEAHIPEILKKFKKSFKDLGVELSHGIYIAENVNYAFYAVYNQVPEVVEEETEIKVVVPISDNDILPYDCDEPEIDLRSLVDEEPQLDKDWMALMGYKDE